MDIFEDMFYMDGLRGKDATGVIAFGSDGGMRVIKDNVEVAVMLYASEWDEIRRDFVKQGKALIGHNRKKTVGENTEEAAHPFVIKDGDDKERYAFVHNGTLSNFYYLNNNLSDIMEEIGVDEYTLPTTKVDSELLGLLLTRCEGDAKKIETILGYVQGAYACMWVDQKEEVLYIVKNHERPLFIAELGFMSFICSETGFMASASNRHGVKLGENLKAIDNETLYSIDLSSHGLKKVEEKLTIKKSQPHGKVTHAATPKAGGKTTSATSTTTEKARITKKSFRGWKKNIIGKVITFYADDYMAYREPLEDGDWVLFGECRPIPFRNNVNVILMGKNLSKEALENWYYETTLYGTVVAASMSTTGEVQIDVDHVAFDYQTAKQIAKWHEEIGQEHEASTALN